MRRLVALVAVVALVSGCAPHDGAPSAPRKPNAGQAQHQPKQDQPQPAPVQGDPSAHNTQPGYVGLFLTWESESKVTPVCEWSKNGVSQPCANMESPSHEGNTWIGIWEHEELAKAGDTYTLTAQGTGAVKTVTCEIAWKGQIHPGITKDKRCGASYTLE